MDIQITGIKSRIINGDIKLSGSKSESNRLLILQRLFPQITIENLSDSDDTQYLQKALSNNTELINVGHAGTAMRFLTAFFASQKGKSIVLSGSDRMHNRPIKILVDSLLELGAHIEYIEKKGYPPLKIYGKSIQKNQVKIKGNVSSQYISALLLIASSLPNGLELHLEGEVTSVPYIEMTLSLLSEIGIQTYFNQKTIVVKPSKNIVNKTLVVESDWSSASYFYSIIALSKVGSKIKLSSFKKESLQGDSILVDIYQSFGVETVFTENSIQLKKISNPLIGHLELDLNSTPDIAQTLAVTAFGLQISCYLTGLHTLKIKETNRLEALDIELKKLGAKVNVSEQSLQLKISNKLNLNSAINTYNDHRMAMAFAPLGILTPITILDANVVTKSYRNFWSDLKLLGFQTTTM